MFCSAQQCMQTLQNSPSADAAVFSGADWTICSVKWSICSGWLQSCVQMCAHQLSVLQHLQTPHQPQPLGQATNLQNLRLASTAQPVCGGVSRNIGKIMWFLLCEDVNVSVYLSVKTHKSSKSFHHEMSVIKHLFNH